MITALTAPLAFALSPLVLLWGRTAVSDALLTALVAFSLLLCWQTYASPGRPWWPALAGAGSGCSHQRTGGGGAAGPDPGAVRLASARHERSAQTSAAPAGPAAHHSGGPPLVRVGFAAGRQAPVGQLHRLSQPAAVHQRGERPPPALVVFLRADAGGQSSLHAPAAAGDSPRRGPAAAGVFSAGAVAAGRIPGSIRRLLAAGRAAVLHHCGHQAAQLLVAGHTRGRPADRPGLPGTPAGKGPGLGSWIDGPGA